MGIMLSRSIGHNRQNKFNTNRRLNAIVASGYNYIFDAACVVVIVACFAFEFFDARTDHYRNCEFVASGANAAIHC